MIRFMIAFGVAVFVFAGAASTVSLGCGRAVTAAGGYALAAAEPTSSAMPLPLKVVKTQVLNSRGERVRLRGVNTACLEWTSNGEGISSTR